MWSKCQHLRKRYVQQFWLKFMQLLARFYLQLFDKFLSGTTVYRAHPGYQLRYCLTIFLHTIFWSKYYNPFLHVCRKWGLFHKFLLPYRLWKLGCNTELKRDDDSSSWSSIPSNIQASLFGSSHYSTASCRWYAESLEAAYYHVWVFEIPTILQDRYYIIQTPIVLRQRD